MRHVSARRLYRPRLEALEGRELLSVCTVDRLGDLDEGKSGRGDFRYCIIESLFRADTITFAVTGRINLTGALPILTRSVTIEGPGADRLTVRRDTGGNYRIFTVAAGAMVTISGLTITNGRPDGGGNGGAGIRNSGTLTVSHSTLTANSIAGDAPGGGIQNSGTLIVSHSTISGNTGGHGGGIFNSDGGTMTVSNSTISGNTVTGRGGGLYSDGTMTVSSSVISGNRAGPIDTGGGINHATGRTTIRNSTISGNTTGAGGGGLSTSAFGTVEVSHSTIVGNTAAFGGGIYRTGPMTTRHTIIAGNTASAGPDIFGNFGSQGYNLLGNPQDASGWVQTDLLHVNPRLGPLQRNGGPTQTHALLPGSPAINAGDPTFAPPPATDQRGRPRVMRGRLDIGAFEQPGREIRPSPPLLPAPVGHAPYGGRWVVAPVGVTADVIEGLSGKRQQRGWSSGADQVQVEML